MQQSTYKPTKITKVKTAAVVQTRPIPVNSKVPKGLKLKQIKSVQMVPDD